MEAQTSCRVITSRVMRKPTFSKCENKDTDQLRGNCEADQHLCFRYMDSTIPQLSKNQNFQPLAIFCACIARFVSDLFENHAAGFLMMRLLFHKKMVVKLLLQLVLLLGQEKHLTVSFLLKKCAHITGNVSCPSKTCHTRDNKVQGFQCLLKEFVL